MQMVAYIGSPTQWMILILVCLVIFGAKRLPEIARGLGRGLCEFKKARREFEEELSKTQQDSPTVQAPPDSIPADQRKENSPS